MSLFIGIVIGVAVTCLAGAVAFYYAFRNMMG